MSGKRMTESRARMEIFLIFVKAIRSVFFNLFMLVLGFMLGFGFYKQCHKVFEHQDYVKFQSWVHEMKRHSVQEEKISTNQTSKVRKTLKSAKSDGK